MVKMKINWDCDNVDLHSSNNLLFLSVLVPVNLLLWGGVKAETKRAATQIFPRIEQENTTHKNESIVV